MHFMEGLDGYTGLGQRKSHCCRAGSRIAFANVKSGGYRHLYGLTLWWMNEPKKGVVSLLKKAVAIIAEKSVYRKKPAAAMRRGADPGKGQAFELPFRRRIFHSSSIADPVVFIWRCTAARYFLIKSSSGQWRSGFLHRRDKHADAAF